jgi:hypothetical protein
LEENTKRLEKHYKKVLDTSIRTHRQKIRNKINNLKSTNPREYWKIINSGNKKNSPEIPIDILFDYFKKLNEKGDDIDDSDINQNNTRVRELNNIINAPITREEIEKAIKSLKNNKSSGDDYFLNEYKNIYHLSRFQMSMLNYLISYLTVDSFQNSGYMGMLFLFTKIMKINMILKMLGRSRF